jgi:LPXTG-motif cell wall-anchored protein
MFVTEREDPAMMGAWYNSLNDLWGDVRSGADWLSRGGRTAQMVAQGAQNATGNLSNLTSWRIDGFTVVAGAAIVGGLAYVLTRRRRSR